MNNRITAYNMNYSILEGLKGNNTTFLNIWGKPQYDTYDKLTVFEQQSNIYLFHISLYKYYPHIYMESR